MFNKSKYREALETRSKLLILCEEEEFRANVMEKCKRDPIFWFSNFCFTDKNAGFFGQDIANEVPFMLFDFQKDFVLDLWDSIQEGSKPISERSGPTNTFIEKSRQMGLSWLVVGVFVYGYLFHNHKYLMISQKEDDVDKPGNIKSLFEKARFIIRLLPNWMLPKGFSKNGATEHNKFCAISRPDGTGSITGESANPNASRGGTYHAIFLDEMATMANAGQINTAAARATPCRIFNSTPNGKGNEYYRIKEDLDKQYEMVENKTLDPKFVAYRWHRIHWSEHPFYDQAWYESQKRGMTPEQVAQELDINYNASVTGRVYPEFKDRTFDVKYEDSLPLYLAIDNSHGGTDPHAVIVCQPTGHYWNIIDYMEINCSVTDLAQFFGRNNKMPLTDSQLEFYSNYMMWKPAIFVADPYDTHSTLNASTIYEEYQKAGIFLNTDITKVKEDQIINTRSNIHRFRLSNTARCKDLMNAICNARYPERKETSNSTAENTKPVHDWTSHGRSALEYLANFLLNNDKLQEEKPKQPVYRKNPLTGQIDIVYV